MEINATIMKWVTFYLLLPFISISYGSCLNKGLTDTPLNKISGEDWSIPQSQVVHGGPGKDDIPALVNPMFIKAANAHYLKDNDLIVGYKKGNNKRAYPHALLNWHEIINDDVGGDKLAVIYCPLTGTATG